MDINRIKSKAQGFLKEHSDKIEEGVGKAEKFAKTKSPKYSDKIDKVAGRVRGLIPEDERRTAAGGTPEAAAEAAPGTATATAPGAPTAPAAPGAPTAPGAPAAPGVAGEEPPPPAS